MSSLLEFCHNGAYRCHYIFQILCFLMRTGDTLATLQLPLSFLPRPPLWLAWSSAPIFCDLEGSWGEVSNDYFELTSLYHSVDQINKPG